MASIKKLPNGSYQATIYVGRDAQGKQIRKYVTKPGWKECKAAAREIEQEIEEGRFINIQNIRVSAWMDKWLELNKERLSPSTYVSYKMYVDKHFKSQFKNIKLNQINEIHIKEYMNEKLKVLSPTTVRKHILVLGEMLGDALKHKNPVAGIKLPEKNEYDPYIPTTEEFEEIRNGFKTIRSGKKDELIILLSGWCGLRRGEIFALKWDDIDYDKLQIRIDEARAISEDGFVIKDPKSKNGFRTIAMPKELSDLIKNYRKSLKEVDELIFPFRPDCFSTHFSEIIKKLNLPPVRFHDLRHYHATWLYENGIPDKYAAERMGHDVFVLKNIYQHIHADKKVNLDETIRNTVTGQADENLTIPHKKPHKAYRIIKTAF